MILKSMSGKLHYAPVDITEGSRILDVGTGTGIWAIEMGIHSLHSPPRTPPNPCSELIEVIGEKYPMAQVLGIDLTPSQPDLCD